VTRAPIGERLERLPATLSHPRFLASEGLGNEIGFHIFAYDPSDEPVVAGYLPRLVRLLQGPEHDVRVLTIDLFELILTLLAERRVLEAALVMEAKHGVTQMEKAVRRIVRPEALIPSIRAKLHEQNPQLVLLVGVGAAYPLVRSHTILNNLHQVVDRVPLVMFFPGSYDGQELRLFDILKDDNYYRAFPLLETVD
jgi:hypothetical protein